MKRFIALCGIVFVLATILAVPVGAEVSDRYTLVAVLTNDVMGSLSSDFVIRTPDGLDPYSLSPGQTYLIGSNDPNTGVSIGDSFVANADGNIPSLTAVSVYIGGQLYNGEITENPTWYDVAYYDFANDYIYLGDTESYTFPIYQYTSSGGSYDEGYEDGYEDGYDEGYDVGKADGADEGFDAGYEQGKREGLDEGYDNGYRDGTADSDDNSWRSLFFGVIEAPVNVLMRLFDFEILGFNLTGLITAVFTLSIVLIVIKWVM